MLCKISVFLFIKPLYFGVGFSGKYCIISVFHLSSFVYLNYCHYIELYNEQCMHKLYYVLYIMSDIGNTADMTAPPLKNLYWLTTIF